MNKKNLLKEVNRPVLSDSYQFNSVEVFSYISELLISLARIESFLLRQDDMMEEGRLMLSQLTKPIQQIPQHRKFSTLVCPEMFVYHERFYVFEQLQNISEIVAEGKVFQNQFKMSITMTI